MEERKNGGKEMDSEERKGGGKQFSISPSTTTRLFISFYERNKQIKKTGTKKYINDEKVESIDLTFLILYISFSKPLTFHMLSFAVFHILFNKSLCSIYNRSYLPVIPQ